MAYAGNTLPLKATRDFYLGLSIPTVLIPAVVSLPGSSQGNVPISTLQRCPAPSGRLRLMLHLTGANLAPTSHQGRGSEKILGD